MRTAGPWVSFFLGFAFLYVLIAVVLLLGGGSVGQALGTPAAVLIGPAMGVAVVRYRKTRADRTP